MALEVLDEPVVNESGAEDVIAFRQKEAHLLFGVGVEVHQLGRLGLHLHGVQQLAVHPEGQRYRFPVGRTLPLQAEANRILPVEFDAAPGLDRAEIDAADFLVLIGVLRFQRLRQGIRGYRAGSDPASGGEIAVHQHGRDREHVADVIETVAQIVGGKVLLGVELHSQ